MQKVPFEDYDNPTLSLILAKMGNDNDYTVSDDVNQHVIQSIARQRGPGFGNARAVRNAFDKAVQNHAERIQIEKEGGKRADERDLKKLSLEDFEGKPRNYQETLKQLDTLVGLDKPKKFLRDLADLLENEKRRSELGLKSDRPALNLVIEGNAGTGKTSLAKIYGNVLKDLGYLSNGEVKVVTASDLTGQHVGEAEVITRKLLEESRGKVLVIDEAYTLAKSEFGKIVIDTLVSKISPESNQDIVVVLAGYPKQMDTMLKVNDGLPRRFPNRFHFEDYNDKELSSILKARALHDGFMVDDNTVAAGVQQLANQRSQPNFGNAGEVVNMLGLARLRQAERLKNVDQSKFSKDELKKLYSTLTPEDLVPKRENAMDSLASINDLVGIEDAKEQFREITAVANLAKRRGDNPQHTFEPYFTFSGPIGTGKKTVADEMGRLFHTLNLLPTRDVVKISAYDLVGQYQGHTTKQTQELLEGALGKTLFIEDVGRLSNTSNPFNREAVEALTDFMKKNRGKLGVVLSGPNEEIHLLLEGHSKLASEINRNIEFNDFSEVESIKIAEREFKKRGKELSSGAKQELEDAVNRLRSAPHWANGVDLSKFIEKVVLKQTIRQVDEEGSSDADTQKVKKEDILKGLDAALKVKGVSSTTKGHSRPISSIDTPAPKIATQEEEAPVPVKAKAAAPKIISKEEPQILHKHEHLAHQSPKDRLSPETQRFMSVLEKVNQKEKISETETKKLSEGKVSDQLAKRIQQAYTAMGHKVTLEQVRSTLRQTVAQVSELKKEALEK